MPINDAFNVIRAKQFLMTSFIYWPHKLILSIRGDEADATLRVKLTEAHTLVEGAVIDGYGLLPTTRKENTSDTTWDERTVHLFITKKLQEKQKKVPVSKS